ncbi:hypothetical protein BHM03_00031587 [Ensete ventricosum]|nr:hypothetical protein BHM03_00031587 [Ensete ventricosum]
MLTWSSRPRTLGQLAHQRGRPDTGSWSDAGMRGVSGRTADLTQVRSTPQRSYDRPDTGKVDTLTCRRMPHRKNDGRGGRVRQHGVISEQNQKLKFPFASQTNRHRSPKTPHLPLALNAMPSNSLFLFSVRARSRAKELVPRFHASHRFGFPNLGSVVPISLFIVFVCFRFRVFFENSRLV